MASVIIVFITYRRPARRVDVGSSALCAARRLDLIVCLFRPMFLLVLLQTTLLTPRYFYSSSTSLEAIDLQL